MIVVIKRAAESIALIPLAWCSDTKIYSDEKVCEGPDTLTSALTASLPPRSFSNARLPMLLLAPCEGRDLYPKFTSETCGFSSLFRTASKHGVGSLSLLEHWESGLRGVNAHRSFLPQV